MASERFIPPPELESLGSQALWLIMNYPGSEDPGVLYDWEIQAALTSAAAKQAL